MSITNIEATVQILESAGIEKELIEQITYAVDYESTVSSLEERLRGGYHFQEIILDALRTTMDFYDADSILIVSLDMDLMIAKPEFEIHREGFMPVCGTEPMFLNEYPEILQAVCRVALNMETFPYTEVLPLLKKGSKDYCRMEQIGIHSIMAAPYSKRNRGFVVVINPHRYKDASDQNTLLQVLSYVTVAEMNEMDLMACRKSFFFDDNCLSPNDVYVKLLNGFELHSKEGLIKEKDIKSNQSVLFLTHLLVKKGIPMKDEALLDLLWDNPELLDIPERTLKNLSYSTKKKIVHLFPENNFLQIGKSSYSINRKYNVVTDLDWFGYRIRDIQSIPDAQTRLDRYLNLLSDFTGTVLPLQDHRSLKTLDDMYEDKREEVQLECLSLMYELEQYIMMHEFINRIILSKNLGEPFTYWQIKANIGMQRIDLAKKLLADNINSVSTEQRKELECLISKM